MSKPQDINFESLIEKSMSQIAGLHLTVKQGVNPFLDAITPEINRYSSLTRSLTSKMGNGFQLLARNLAKEKFGVAAVPNIIFQKNEKFDLNDPKPDVKDTLILSKLDPKTINYEANKLIHFAKTEPNGKIGTKLFRKELTKSRDLIHKEAKSRPHQVQVDLFVDTPQLGFCETESGGELDSSNSKAQPAKLIMAALASDRLDMTLHFCLAYANRGEGKPIAGGLKRLFLNSDETETGDSLLVGKEWWETLLPPSTKYEDFLKIFNQTCLLEHHSTF